MDVLYVGLPNTPFQENKHKNEKNCSVKPNTWRCFHMARYTSWLECSPGAEAAVWGGGHHVPAWWHLASDRGQVTGCGSSLHMSSQVWYISKAQYYIQRLYGLQVRVRGFSTAHRKLPRRASTLQKKAAWIKMPPIYLKQQGKNPQLLFKPCTHCLASVIFFSYW